MGFGDVKVNQCGVKFKPPALVLTYEDGSGKLRRRTMPVRSMTKNSQVDRVAADMKSHSSSQKYLSSIKQSQLLRLLSLIKDHLLGLSLDESLERSKQLDKIDPNEDLNKVDDETLKRKKAVMEDSFAKNSLTPADDDFEYDKEVDFEQDGEPIETVNWSDEDSLTF